MEYVYENSGQYEDWVEGSDLYISLQKKNKDLADFAEASVVGFAKLNAEIDKLKEENEELRVKLELMECGSEEEAIARGLIKEKIEEVKDEMAESAYFFLTKFL